MIGLLLACVLAMTGCKRAAPEEAIREQVAALQSAIEARSASDVAAVLDDDFIGPQNMDRRAARQLAAVMMLRHQRIGVLTGPLDITLQGEDRAMVRTRAAVSGADGSARLPDSAQAWRVESGWRLRDGVWRINRLDWTPVLE
ncbi:nuclear transport factor 2 family protein [Luteimonas sp. 9C]|uniref:nuclear transport factor 2 family protein n=1 Tax=Luteimonas sp. 9C TaxID=2653148 RepID=UPI00135996B1|nr:nuclear transport factor 2 family protein [Luteimonas sp. 9C]